MSFLNAIISKKQGLKTTDTVVTQLDGSIFRETKDKLELIGKKVGYVVDSKPDQIPAKIVEHLYLGSQDCCEETVLREYKIKYVLSVGVEAPEKDPDVTYKFVECLDLPETDLKSCLRKCIPFIESAVSQFHNVLVHCNAGVSRSSSIVIAYLILVEHYDYIQAYNFVKNARSCIKPNSGFERQLLSLCNTL